MRPLSIAKLRVLGPLPALLLALALGAPTADASSPAAVDQTLEEVSRAYQKGNIEEARTQLIEAMKASPGEIPLHVAYIEMMIGLGQREAVEEVYGGLVITNKRDAVSLYLHGLTLDTPEARQAAFKESQKAAPRFPWAHLGLASAALNLGHSDQALAHVRDALVLDQTLEPALELFGTLLAANGQLEEAIIAYEALAEQNTAIARPHEALSRLYTMSGKQNKAIESLKAATRISPNDASLYANLGYALFQQKVFTEALEAYKNAARLVPGDELSVLMVSVTERVMSGTLAFESVSEVQQARSVEGQDARRAFELYQAAAKRDPDFELAQLGLGNAYLRQGDVKKAAEALKAAIDINPNSSEIRVAYARLMIELKATGEAEKHLRKALELQPESFDILLSLADLYRTMGDPRRAEIAYRAALPMVPPSDAKTVAVNLAGSLAAQGRLEESIEIMEEVLREGGPNVDLYLTLAELYRESEAFGQALGIYGKILEIEPEHPEVPSEQRLTQTAWDTYKEDMRTKNRARQILLKDQASAEKLLKELQAGGDFATLARAKGTGREAVDGGDLGFFEPGSLAAPLSDALAKLPVGGMTGVIKTEAGYHILLRTN